MNLFITCLWRDPRLFFTVAVIIVFSICAHEFMHAFAALKLGDDTAAEKGHLTMNPFKQMGLFSLLLFCLFGLAWGRVPVNPGNLRGKYAPALVAFAGPLTNLLLSSFFAVLTYFCYKHRIGDEFAINMLYYGSTINVVIFVLNMIPVPGFDGFAILTNIFPRFLQNASEAMRGTVFLLIMLLFVFFDQLFKLGNLVTGFQLLVLQWLLG